MSDLRLAVTGAAGRMGRMLLETIPRTSGAALTAALEGPSSPFLATDSGLLIGGARNGVAVTADVEAAIDACDAVIDFSTPAASVAVAKCAAAAGRPMVIGTTGFCGEEVRALAECARRIAIMRSGNMSLGVNLLAALVERAAKTLSADWDIEIVEMHHRLKVDAPSGTALLLGEAAARGRGVTLDDHAMRGRDGLTGPRRESDIGFASLRGGSVVGDHSVIFAGAGERLELSHRAEDRGIFARGAVAAALWTRGRAPGLYSMADVLGLNATSAPTGTA